MLFLVTLNNLIRLETMIIAREFYCLKEGKMYREGEKYTGNRKDLGSFLKMETKENPKKKKPRKRIPKKTTKK